MKTRYVADCRTTICLDGLRYIRRSDHIYPSVDTPNQYWLNWAHKGEQCGHLYHNECDRDRMYNLVVEGLVKNGGVIYVTDTAAVAR